MSGEWKPSPLALVLVAEVVDADPVDDDYAASGWSGDGREVRVTLGGYEVARIKGDDISHHGGDVDLTETVAGWLREKLG